jgi:pimeloyl-ACP methyl ester carboxylesterase
MLADTRRFNDPATNRESLDPRSWTTYDRIDRIDVPLWDVVGDQRPQLPAAVDADTFEAAWTAGQRRLARLASDSHVVTAPGADDVIWRSHPDLVVSTVTDALTP